MPGSGEYVFSLAKGLAVIRAFDREHPHQSLSEVSRAVGLSRASARRSLLTLVELGYVRTDGPTFWLTPRVLDLGFSYLSSLTLPEVAQPHLEVLAAEIHESTSMSILDGADIVYVARVAVKRIMAVSITIGTRFPAYKTSMGRVLLADMSPEVLSNYLKYTTIESSTPHAVSTPASLRAALERVRHQGYAIVDQELEEGLRSVAVPVRAGPDECAVAGINISTHVSRYSERDIHRNLLPPLLRTAANIGQDYRATIAATPAPPLMARGTDHA